MGPILRETTLSPLARQVGTLDEMPYYKLSHPDAVTAREGLRLFTETRLGERLQLMYSSQEGLLQRSLNAVRIEPEYGMAGNLQPIGALVVFCAGCRLALGDSLSDVVGHFSQRLGRSPLSRHLPSASRGDCPTVSWPMATSWCRA